jgi:3'-phosphoadenosine 5'-phosphosulfate sulfotransferase (PAPS reductase)/FAD synthetase/ferredoxin
VYSYIFDRKTHGYLLTTQTGKYVANEIRPVFAPELSLTGLGRYFEYDRRESRPLCWGIKNTYLIADIDDKGQPVGRKIAQLNNTQYGKPLNLQVFFDGKMKLEPVDVEAMVAANAQIMDIVIADAKRRTKELYDESIKRCDIAYIAFSGGKDSVALLDICHRVLPLSVPVVFSDTDMELPDTYKVWDEIQTRYPEREFIVAKSETSALENWRIFAPPSRTVRWCCSVHKSTPALMFLKKKLKKPAIKVMAFVGVRGDESYSRSFYEDATDGVKNASQMNCMPILDWGAHELWLYIFANDLLINCAYKKGLSRVGCLMCPESSEKYEWFVSKSYPRELKPYSDIIIGTSAKHFSSATEKSEYIGKRHWQARRSGIVLRENITPPLEEIDGLNITFQSPHFKKDLFYEWIKTLGIVVKERETERQLLKVPKSLDEGIPFVYRSPYTGGGLVSFKFHSSAELTALVPLIRSLLKKVSGCIGCQSCEAECNLGAITFMDGKLKVNGDKCIKCHGCYDIENSCWRYRSMYKPENSKSVANEFARYNNFGLREEFIDALLERGNTFFHWDSEHPIGDKKVDACKKWFPQALIVTKDRKHTQLVELFRDKTKHDIAWEFVWMALVNNSPLINWYCVTTELDERKEVQSLLESLQESYPLTNNAKDRRLDALKNTADSSPLGGDSNAPMLPEYKGSKVIALTRKAKDVHPLTILYGLYLIADLAERSSFTVRELLTADAESTFVSPLVAFGIAPDIFKKQCEGLRTRYPDYISTTFTHGNDGLEVYSQKHSLEDIVNLALGE